MAYALAFCQEANPASVNFAFIDGYKNDIKENKYLTQVINKFEKKNSKKINFITTTILNWKYIFVAPVNKKNHAFVEIYKFLQIKKVQNILSLKLFPITTWSKQKISKLEWLD